MKTYTKKIGATRAIAAITAANTELFELEVIKLEEIKGEDGSFHIRATVSDPNVIDLERLKAETRIGEVVITEQEAPAPKPSILEMAMTVEQARIASPKETPDEARAAALVMYGADAKEGVDFEIVKGGRGLFSALRPEIAATFKRTTQMVLTAEEASAAKNRKRIEQADRPKRTRGDGTKPVGMQAIVAELCLREQGATPAELKAATNWQGTPWKWFLGNNPKKTGMADRFGYQFEARKGAGKEVTYFFRLPEAVDAQASTTDNEQQVAAA